MRRASVGRLVLGAAAVLVAAGLAARVGEPEPEPRELTLSAGAPSAVEGEDFVVSGYVLGRLDGRWATFRGWAGDGTEVYTREARVWDYGIDVPQGGRVRQAQPQREPGDRDPRQVALVARESPTSEPRVLSDHARQDPGIEYRQVQVAGDHVVWVEGRQERYGALFAYDLSTGTETLLLDGDGADGRPWPSAYARPVVRDGLVHFVGYRPGTPPENSNDTSVYEVPLTGGEPREVVPGARDVYPAPDGRLDVVEGTRLVRWDPERGGDGEVEGSSLPAARAVATASGVRVALDEAGGVIRIDSPRYGRTDLRLDGRIPADLNASDRWVAFTVPEWGRAVLLDLDTGTLRRLDDAKYASTVPTAGGYVYTATGLTAVPIAPESHRVIDLLPRD